MDSNQEPARAMLSPFWSRLVWYLLIMSGVICGFDTVS